MQNPDLTFGQYLEQARREARLSIRHLAELSGIQKTIVGRMLLDQVQQPKPDHLMRLAQVLELPAADLFLLAGVPIPAELPSVEALLRTEYDLPDAAIAEAKQQIDAIVARYARTNRKEDNHGNNKHTR